MSTQGNIQKLKVARDKLAEVYEAEAIDELHDNGNLSEINNAILSTENAIRTLEKRGE